MFSINSLLGMNRLFIVFAFLLSSLKYSDCETTCSFKNTCKCVFQNGSIIDLSSLGNQNNKPRWKDMKPTLPNDHFLYSYNPCFSFSLGPPNQACGKGVAVCQVNDNKTAYYDCGDSENVKFSVNEKNVLQLKYTTGERSTNVTLICSEDATMPELTVIGESSTKLYEMTLKTRCACPDLCTPSHLSTGSVLVIIFVIFVVLYIFLGIIHSSLTRGAHGWELIPHYEFWADFPLLVRDGCVFVVSGCKPETAYERI